jgi:hypothetical protein
MPKTKGARDIQGWREYGLIRDLALNEKTAAHLAEDYDVAEQTVYDFKMRHKAEVAAVLAEWSDEFAGLWSAKKYNRVADIQHLAGTIQDRMDELLEDAAMATEVMRSVNPDAAPVRVPLREWQSLVREKARLVHQIADELGQLPPRIAVTSDAGRTAFDEVALDANGNLLTVVRR